MSIEELVEEFAFQVAAQTEAMMRGRPGTGNRHARRYSAAFEKLRAQGDAGMKALAMLLTHPREDVRTVAASFLQHPDRPAEPEVETVTRRPKALRPRPHWRQPLELPASLSSHRSLLEGALAPCILFDKKEGSAHSRGCGYGGLPLVPAGTLWPRSPEGALHFLGQLDFAELAACRGEALPELPKEGLLAFFYDVENQPWGREPSDRAFWQLIYVPPGVEPVPLQPPEDLMEAERPVLPPCRLTPVMGRCLPDWWDLHAPIGREFWSEEQADDYIELRRKLVGGRTVDDAVDQLRGHPAWIQEDARIEAQLISSGEHSRASREPAEEAQLKQEAAQWNLLWQVGFDEEQGFAWGSSGTVYVLIRDEDLRACRFEHAWLFLQCT